MDKQRVIVYIDGFNFYYGLKKDDRWKKYYMKVDSVNVYFQMLFILPFLILICIYLQNGRLSNEEFRESLSHRLRPLYIYVKTTQERYDELVSKYPNQFELFTLKDIASFLDITPTHMSRLRQPDKNNRNLC